MVDVMRLVMICGLQTVAMTGRQVKKMEVAKLKMVRWALNVTIINIIIMNYMFEEG